MESKAEGGELRTAPRESLRDKRTLEWTLLLCAYELFGWAVPVAAVATEFSDD